MNAVNQYRTIAEDCMRRANAERDERDRPLWFTLAQSWLRLAEHAENLHGAAEPEDSADEHQVELSDRVSALN